MPNIWTMQIAGGPGGSLGGFQIEQVNLQFRSLATDTVTFNRAARYDAARLLDYGGIVALSDHTGKRRFYGRRLNSPGRASGQAQAQDYELGGPWDWLESITFHQTFAYRTVAGGALQTATQLVPRAILNVGSSNEQLTIGAQIRRVLEYAILRGAPIAIGEITIDTVLRASEVVALSCATIIRNQLVYAPDAVAWFDYTTTPYPTFHCLRRGSLNPVTLSLEESKSMASGYAIEVISPLNAVENDRVPCVALYYEVTDTHDGEPYVYIVPDIAPVGATGLAEKTLTDVIPLQGRQTTSISAELGIEALPSSNASAAEKMAFVQRFHIFLEDTARCLSPEVIAITYNGSPAAAYDNWITEGSPADWMDLDWVEQKVVARMRYTYKNTAGEVMKKEEDQPLAMRLKVTSAAVTTAETTGLRTYSTLTSEEQGDPIPTGLAAALLASLNGLEWEGAIQITEQQASDILRMGLVLNLSGTADARHASMSALIRSISIDIATGQTTANIGPGGVLSLDRRLEMIKSNYLRRRWTSITQQQTGTPNSESHVNLGPIGGGGNDTIHAPGSPSYLAVRSGGKSIVSDGSAPSQAVTDGAASSVTTPGRELHTKASAIVDVNAADVTGTAKFRTTNICVLVGTTPTTYPVKLLRTAYPGEA